jgi:hypothetical protein
MDAVKVNDSVLGGDLALLERICHEQIPHVAIFDIFAERRPGLVGRVLLPGPLRLLPDRLVPGERAARAQDHIRDLALFQVARLGHDHNVGLDPLRRLVQALARRLGLAFAYVVQLPLEQRALKDDAPCVKRAFGPTTSHQELFIFVSDLSLACDALGAPIHELLGADVDGLGEKNHFRELQIADAAPGSSLLIVVRIGLGR